MTSALFPGGKFDESVLASFSEKVGKDRLVVDIRYVAVSGIADDSCRRRESGWIVAMNGWKTLTDLAVTAESIRLIEGYCSELLIHAADVEGLCQGVDEELVQREYECNDMADVRPGRVGLHTVYLCRRCKGAG